MKSAEGLHESGTISAWKMNWRWRLVSVWSGPNMPDQGAKNRANHPSWRAEKIHPKNLFFWRWSAELV